MLQIFEKCNNLLKVNISELFYVLWITYICTCNAMCFGARESFSRNWQRKPECYDSWIHDVCATQSASSGLSTRFH